MKNRTILKMKAFIQFVLPRNILIGNVNRILKTDMDPPKRNNTRISLEEEFCFFAFDT